MYANPTVQRSVKELYQEDFPNDSEKKGAFVLVKKLPVNNRYSWSTDTALVSNYLIKVNVSPPPKMGLKNDVKETLLLDKDEYKSVDVPKEFQASRSEVVHPGTTLKARVVINETVTEYPWAVEVTIKGCIAVKYRQPVAGKLLHCYPVSNLVAQEKLLTRTPDTRIVKFTAKGKFSAVQHSGIKVEVEEEDTGAIDWGPSSDDEDDEEEQ
ncbi:uncharacterized protein LOC135387903 [Ornithodoros turicata]|uniref:uncharacterized protein LOC135387903 n=1 Tax=Ornithodoros turicata TaxID=34597 RepID=UPI0031394977